MNQEKIQQSITQMLDAYRVWLDRFTDNQFQQCPGEGIWSPSEIYHHIMDSSLLSLEAIHAIERGNIVAGDASLVGKAILLAGAFPPGLKFKVPKKLEGRAQKISKEQAAEMLARFAQELLETLPFVERALPGYRVQHPRLGAFNALQWLRFIEIHLGHHLKQLARVNNTLQ